MSEKEKDALDDWDESFLEEAIRSMDALTSKNQPSILNATQQNPRNPNQPPLSRNFPPIPFVSDGGVGRDIGRDISFSPPRELSQRPALAPYESESTGSGRLRNAGYGSGGGRGWNRKDKEMEGLKWELAQISKQLLNVEKEHKELQKDKEEKEKKLKCAYSQIEAKDAEIYSLKRANLEASKQYQLRSSLQFHSKNAFPDMAGHYYTTEDGLSQGIPQAVEHTTKGFNDEPTCVDPQAAVSELNQRVRVDTSMTTSNGLTIQESYFPGKTALKSTVAVGDQVTTNQDCCQILQNVSSVDHNTMSKLLGIWGSPGDKMSGRNLISELFVTCSSDLCVLFKYMSLPSRTSQELQSDRSLSDMVFHDGIPYAQASIAAKVSQVYETLLKMRNEVMPLQTLVAALLDLCTLENVAIAYRSLRLLHAILRHISCSTRFHGRNNILVDQSLTENISEGRSSEQEKLIGKFCEFEKAKGEDERSLLNVRNFVMGNLPYNEERILRTNMDFSFENLMNLFEKMQQVAFCNTEECVQIEALSIMILILLRSNPDTEREKFWLRALLEKLPQFLHNEVGLHVRQRAVRLLFLLLNCSKLLEMFCDWQRNDVELGNTTDERASIPALQGGISHILEGLAECLSFEESSTQNLKLRRDIIFMLAFIASSGKSGFDILLYSSTPQRLNFLELIVRVLASAMDADITNDSSQDFCKERISLMRETLILLNRLASNPTYSRTTLGVLTSGGVTASLTIDVANRIPRRSQNWKHDGTKRTQVEAEIVDLARLFKSRVFSFLGVNEP